MNACIGWRCARGLALTTVLYLIAIALSAIVDVAYVGRHFSIGFTAGTTVVLVDELPNVNPRGLECGRRVSPYQFPGALRIDYSTHTRTWFIWLPLWLWWLAVTGLHFVCTVAVGAWREARARTKPTSPSTGTMA